MDILLANTIVDVLDALIDNNAVRATKFISEKEIVRAKRKTFGKKIVRGNVEIILTIGRPNFEERNFIKNCKKAGESFPIKKIQLKFISK